MNQAQNYPCTSVLYNTNKKQNKKEKTKEQAKQNCALSTWGLYQVKTQYLQILNKEETYIGYQFSGQSTFMFKGCMYICFI